MKLIVKIKARDSAGAGEIYTSEKNGSDEAGNGSQDKPFKTILQAMRHAGKEPFPQIFADGKSDDKVIYFLLQNLSCFILFFC